LINLKLAIVKLVIRRNDESITRSEFIRESSLDFLSYKIQEREREKIRKDRKKQ